MSEHGTVEHSTSDNKLKLINVPCMEINIALTDETKKNGHQMQQPQNESVSFEYMKYNVSLAAMRYNCVRNGFLKTCFINVCPS
jgi:hypothetical protein